MHFGEFIVRNRLIVIITCILAIMAAAYGGSKLRFENNYRVFFSEDNPQLIAFEEFQKTFTKTDNILITIKPDNGDIYSAKMVQLIAELTEKSWQTPYSTRVDSLTNYQHTFAEDEDLIVEDLLRVPHLMEEVGDTEPTIKGRLVSENADATGVNITVNLPMKDPAEVIEAGMYARQMIAEMEQKYPQVTFALSGVVMMNNAFQESSMNDMMTLVPLMYLVIIIVMFVLLRSLLSVIATIFLIGFSVMGAMGLAGWFGIPLTPPSASAPTIILTLAVADSIHFLITMLKEMARGLSRRDAIVESIRINLMPIFLTSVTTAIGFLALNFSDAPPFRDLGNITAMGVMIAFVLSVTFLPAVISYLPIKSRLSASDSESSTMEKIANFAINKRRAIVPFFIILLGILTYGATQLKLNDEFVKYFDERIKFRTDTDFTNQNLTGIYVIEFPVGASEPQGINEPEYLNNLEKFANWLSEQPEVRHIYSVGDIVKRLNKNMNRDEEQYYDIPESRELAAQYLFLYELSLPQGLEVNDRINIDKSQTRLTATLYDISAEKMRELEIRANQWQANNLPEYMRTLGTSTNLMFAHISKRNIESMNKGNLIAFVLISLAIGIALRSFKLGVLSLIPNMIPALMALGTWGFLSGDVNLAVAIIVALSLGIIVDDTVHILSKYQRGRKEKGLSVEDSIRYSFKTTGAALFVTTVILACGFGVLATSAFALNSITGILVSITIVCALIADFFLLPAVLIAIEKLGKK